MKDALRERSSHANAYVADLSHRREPVPTSRPPTLWTASAANSSADRCWSIGGSLISPVGLPTQPQPRDYWYDQESAPNCV